MDQHTATDSDALLSLIQPVKENYHEPPPAPLKRGKQRDFSALSFLLLAVVAMTKAEVVEEVARDIDPAEARGRATHRCPAGEHHRSLKPEAEG